MKHSDYINLIHQAEYDVDKKVYHLHMTNVFSNKQYHLTIPKNLFDKMMDDPIIMDSSILQDLDKENQKREVEYNYWT